MVLLLNRLLGIELKKTKYRKKFNDFKKEKINKI